MPTILERPGLLVGFGVLSWLVPFVVSIPLVGPDGEPVVDVFAFKTVMILVGAAVGAVLLAAYVPRLHGGYLRGAVVAGVGWFVVNVVLDLVVLVYLLGTPLEEWAVGVGARYLVIPIVAASVGYVADAVRPTVA